MHLPGLWSSRACVSMMASLSGAHLLPLLPLTLYNTHIILYLYCIIECCIMSCCTKREGERTVLYYNMLYYITCYMHILQPMANRLATSACLRLDAGHGTPFLTSSRRWDQASLSLTVMWTMMTVRGQGGFCPAVLLSCSICAVPTGRRAALCKQPTVLTSWCLMLHSAMCPLVLLSSRLWQHIMKCMA